jgi:hypothetical protein
MTLHPCFTLYPLHYTVHPCILFWPLHYTLAPVLHCTSLCFILTPTWHYKPLIYSVPPYYTVHPYISFSPQLYTVPPTLHCNRYNTLCSHIFQSISSTGQHCRFCIWKSDIPVTKRVVEWAGNMVTLTGELWRRWENGKTCYTFFFRNEVAKQTGWPIMSDVTITVRGRDSDRSVCHFH